MKPNIYYQNVETQTTEMREMTDEEYADLLATGWTEEATEPPA